MLITKQKQVQTLFGGIRFDLRVDFGHFFD